LYYNVIQWEYEKYYNDIHSFLGKKECG